MQLDPVKLGTRGHMMSKSLVIFMLYAIVYGEGIPEKYSVRREYNLVESLTKLYTLQSEFISDEVCKNDSRQFYEDLRQFKPWAIQMVDASTKFQSGFLLGNVVDYGSYDACVRIKKQSRTDESRQILGKHCTLLLKPDNKTIQILTKALPIPPERLVEMTMPTTFGSIWSLCIPDTCPARDIEAHFQKMVAELLDDDSLTITADDSSCFTIKENSEYRTGDIITLLLLGLCLTLIILSTAYDLLTHLTHKESPSKILKSFSVYENTKMLLEVKEGGQIAALNGLRFLSTCWVIISHRFLFKMGAGHINTVDIQKWMRDVHSMIIMGSTVSVDTFFVISGMLTTLSFFQMIDKDRKVNLRIFYLHRYLRLTPSLAIVVLLNATLIRYMGSGPFWSQNVIGLEAPCRQHWWASLLFIQNYINPELFCMVQTWYISVDIQLFWLSPLLLYPLYKKPAFGLPLLVMLIIIPMGVSFYLAWIHNYNGSFHFSPEALQTQYFQYHYTSTHVRASTWYLGVALGYITYKTKNKNVNIHPVLVGLLWLLAFMILILTVYGIYPFQQFETPLLHVRASCFLAFSRTAWATAICWILFACINGYGGLINSFLSWSAFTILGKLGYTMFLVHLGMQFITVFSMKAPAHFAVWNMVLEFFGDMGLTLLVSYILTIGFEMPLFVIEDYFLKKTNKDKDS